jgi:histidinol-phosphate aminotransferase
MSGNLARPEIVRLKAYTAAAQQHDTLRLNANEVSWNPGADPEIPAPIPNLNRYPQVRPWALRDRLAAIYGVAPDNLLVTRGSSEAIDLLTRVFCIPAVDNVIVTPPTFGMYRVYADIQQAEVRQLPLAAESNFSLDIDRLLDLADDRSKLIFVCSPNNPTGNSILAANLESLLQRRCTSSLIVVDEAYIEFSREPSFISLTERYENLVVLRTLSKAYGLAAARIGAVIANPDVVRLLDSVMAPYAVATPVVDCALHALSAASLARTSERVRQLSVERGLVVDALSGCDAVETVWPSDGNFVLVRFRDLEAVRQALIADRILIRDFSAEPGLHNCARITIGSKAENSRLIAALRKRI